MENIILSADICRELCCTLSCSKFLPRVMQIFWYQGIYDLVIMRLLTNRRRPADIRSKFTEYILDASHGKELLQYLEITKQMYPGKALELQSEIIEIANTMAPFSEQIYDRILPKILEIVDICSVIDDL